MKNIIITGGGLANKGAQAMTLIAADALHRKYPDHRICLYSETDCHRPETEKSVYTFSFVGWHPIKFARAQKNFLLRQLCLLRNGRELRETEELYRNTDLMVDISGYAVGSNWSDKIVNDFLDSLEYAEAFHIPVYLLPQSFGPFDFPEDRKPTEDRLRKLLPTVKKIYAREEEGYRLLRERYGLRNVERGEDIVLTGKEIRLESVYQTPPELHLPEIPDDSVGLIPNSRNFSVGNSEELYDMYHKLIAFLRSEGKTVFLLLHSSADRECCRILKNRWNGDADVRFLDRDFDCLEFNRIVGKFRFLIASRFHSIVHAYKNGVPCLVIGWAVKYHELLSKFGQESYLFDVREGISLEHLKNMVIQMENQYRAESEKITEVYRNLQHSDIFDQLPERL